MHRTQPDGDPARDRKRAADLLQGQVGLPGNQLQHLRAVLAQPAATLAAHRARARMALGPPALRPASSAADTDIKPCRRRPCAAAQRHETDHTLPQIDRKSTRLNSSHMSISYAVFCLKKKKKNQISTKRQHYQQHYSDSRPLR